MTNIQTFRNKLEQRKGRRDQLLGQIEQATQSIRESKRVIYRHEQAREVIRQVGLKTQQQLQYHISEITSLAMQAVFSEPYELKVEFVERRNKTECDLFFERDREQVDPLSAAGGGAVDVAAFALRIASWSMETPKSRPVLLLDEPFSHLKGPIENRKVLEMVKQISHSMGIQIIMISDERISREDIIEASDKVFQVSMRKRISIVE